MNRTRIIIATLLLFLSGAATMYAGGGSRDLVKGVWMKPGETEDTSFSWKAGWIWLPENEECHVMLARKTFSIGDGIQQALLRISASDSYQLYINGSYVCRGPARSAAHHQSYDILDVTGLLKSGENTLAVRVHHQQGKQWYQYPGRGGLLAQLDLSGSGGGEIIASNGTWKVSHDPSWSDEAPNISRFQDFVNDRVDFRNYYFNWEKNAFDDNTWSQARMLYRNSGWPAVQKDAPVKAVTIPWTTLVPRELPYLEESDLRAEQLLAATEIIEPGLEVPIHEITAIPISTLETMPAKSIQKALREEATVILPAGRENQVRILIFDFGEVVIGMPKLVIQGEKGSIIDIMCAPYILNDNFTHKIIDSHFLDRIVLSGEKDAWEATYFKPARYMAVAVRGSSGKVILHYAGIHRMAYPFVRQGSVEAPGAAWIESYMDASMKTLRVCTTDGYTDNYRERRQYAQTGFYAALGNYWTFGDYALQRRYLLQIAQEQKANGIMPAYAPLSGSDYMVIFDSNCLWIRSLRNYLLYSGDYATVRELLPAALRLMELMQSYTESSGMINDPPYAYWLDHADLDRRGANFTLNGHYLGALEDFSEVLEWLGEDDAESYLQQSVKLRKSMQMLWDPERKLFADALVGEEPSPMFSEHSNAMALALHIATPGQAESIAEQLLAGDKHNYIRRENGLVMVTPAMSWFLHKGLCEYGFVKESFTLFRDRFDKMLAEGTNRTLWEEWFIDGTGRTGKLQKKTRSDAQTESAFPPALFAEYLFGIEVLSPGMKRVKIRPVSSGVKELKGQFPTPEGILSVDWNFERDGRGGLKLEVPGEMEVIIDLTEPGTEEGKTFILDAKEVNFHSGEKEELVVGAGRHELMY